MMQLQTRFPTSQPAAILMVDDHPANLTALEALLEPLGHRLVRAASGQEALKLVLQEEFAVILMDVQMPGMDGFETAALIKQRDLSRHVPIIFLTATCRDEANIVRGYAHGAVDYLLKPLDATALRAKVALFVVLFQKERALKLEAAEHQRRAAARFGRILQTLAEGVLVVDSRGELVEANPAAQRLLGITPEELPGWNVARLGWTGSGGFLSLALQSAEAQECGLQLPDGGRRILSVKAAPLHALSDPAGSLVICLRDLTAQRMAEEEARQAPEFVEHLANGVAHDLRRPPSPFRPPGTGRLLGASETSESV